MLNKDEKLRLHAITCNEAAGDPRFARAMSRGTPRAPREYRARRLGWVPVGVALLGASLVAVHNTLLLPVIGVAGAVAIILVARSSGTTWQDQPVRRRVA